MSETLWPDVVTMAIGPEGQLAWVYEPAALESGWAVRRYTPQPHLPGEDRERLLAIASKLEREGLADGDLGLSRQDAADFLRNLASAPSGGEQRRVVEAAHRFLECSQRIERRGAEGEMEEYEEAWRDLEAALSDQGTGGAG